MSYSTELFSFLNDPSNEKLEVQSEFEPHVDFHQRAFLWSTWSKLSEKVNTYDKEQGSKVKRRV